MRRLTPVDAQTYWLASSFPNDSFVVYGFDGVPGDLDEAVGALARRARTCVDLTVRVEDDFALRYPAWRRCDVDAEQFVVHSSGPSTWSALLAEMPGLIAGQLDAQRHAWRVRVYPNVDGIPGATGPGTVAVVQMSHALADGNRGAALAATLFGRRVTVPRARPPRWGSFALPWRTVRAIRTHRMLARDAESRVVPAPNGGFAALRTNTNSGPVAMRTVTRARRVVAEPTVTTSVLASISRALSDHLRELGDAPSTLGAEVPMAKAGVRLANNHFGNVGIGLYPGVARAERLTRIAADLAARRQRAAHPGNSAAALAFAATPAVLLRWGVRQFDPATRSETVTGNTVVSSVDRGAADLTFGAAPVVMTTGFPALSPMMGLTHGVHGIGDVVTVSVHAAESAIGDVDAYVSRLEAALGDDSPATG